MGKFALAPLTFWFWLKPSYLAIILCGVVFAIPVLMVLTARQGAVPWKVGALFFNGLAFYELVAPLLYKLPLDITMPFAFIAMWVWWFVAVVLAGIARQSANTIFRMETLENIVRAEAEFPGLGNIMKQRIKEFRHA